MEMSRVRVTVSISEEIKEKLDQFAEKLGIDRSAALEAILEQHFEGNNQSRPSPTAPSVPAPAPPTPAPTPAPVPAPPAPQPQLPPNLLGKIDALETLTKRLEKELFETRHYLAHAYPAFDTMSNWVQHHHSFHFGLMLNGAIIPSPGWWDPKKAPRVPLMSLPTNTAEVDAWKQKAEES